MIELVKQQHQVLGALCVQYGVRRLEVFGSAATGDFNEQSSDIDFLVEFLPLEPSQSADAYFGLLFALEKLFGRSIDLVMPSAVKNPYFLQSINQSREVLYAA